MKKFRLSSLLIAPLAISPIISVVSCGNNTPSTTTYTITYDATVPTGMTLASDNPTSTKNNTKVEVKYTIADGYKIDSTDSSITVGTTDITSSCTFTSTTLTIPADKVTGNITIKLATEPDVGTVYNVTYTKVNKINWTSCPSTVNSGNNLTAEYTITDSDYSLDWNNCSIKSGSTEIKGYCTLESGIITVPANKITGDITITLAVKEVAEYDVNYGPTPTGLSWTSQPTKIKSNQNLTITYTLNKVGEDNYIIDTSNSEILVGSTSIKNNISYTNGTIIIPSAYLSDDITVTLATKKDTFDGQWQTTDADVTDTTTGLTAISHLIEIKPKSSNGTANVTLTGNFNNSQIYINTKGDYNITFNNCNISNTDSTDSDAEQPFLITKKATSVNIILADNSVNTINDKRSDTTITYSNDVALQSKSTGSFTISGNGKLDINNVNTNKGPTAKAIQTKGDLTINKQAQLNVFAIDTAIQAAGALTINNATVIANSYSDDGIKTKFEDPSDDLALAGAGNIKRDITISGGSYVQVYSARNGINAAHDFITSADATGTPTINCYTSSTYAGSKVKDPSLDEQNMYVAIPESYNPYADIENYFYTVTFKDSTSVLKDTTEVLTLKKIKGDDQPGPGPRSNSGTYYYYKCDRPLKAYNQFVITKYAKEQFGAETMSAYATSSTCTISNGTSTNTKDTIKVSSISSGTINTESTSCSANYKQLIGQNEKIDTVVGSKGIKAKNNINITTGEITIKSKDTCIATSYGDIYCNSATAGDITFGIGDISISGGTLTCESSEGDGVKAYGKMNVSGGLLSVNKSIEALEAGVINILGGTTKLKASDDGMNASQVGKYYTDLVTITISGGVLDVQTTSSSDTDAIDSNNTITISGGLIIARVPGSNPSSAFDWENGNLQMSNATFVALGTVEKTVSGGTSYTGYSGLSSRDNHTITYYTSSSTTATYTYNNATSMNSSITVRSNYSKPTFN